MSAPDPAGPRTDAELLAAHVGGEPEAFGELFGRHRDRLWAVALRTMGNPDDAADGLQDGMVAAYRRAGSFRGEAQVTTWLHRVVVNACLDRLRALKVRRAEPLPDDLEEYGGRGALVSATSRDGRADTDDPGDPAAASLRSEQGRRIVAALGELPVEQRTAIVLVDLEGHPLAEAAEMLGCAVGTVKSRCSRGRRRLAVLLADLVELDDPGGSGPAGPAGNRGPRSDVRSSSPPRAPPATERRPDRA